MGKKNFSEEQLAFALGQAESDRSLAEIIRKLGISDADFLPMEEAVCWAWCRHVTTASDLGGGEQEAEAFGCGPEPR